MFVLRMKLSDIVDIYRKPFQGLSKDVLILALMMVINRLGTLILPFLTLYTTEQLGWTEIRAGDAAMWFGVGSLVGAYTGGILTDKIGYYKTMTFSLLMASILFYTTQYFTEYNAVCGLLFLSSCFADLLRPALMTGITNFTTKETQTRAVSLLRIAFNFGLSIGPTIAGPLIIVYGYQVIFKIDAITCFAAFVFLLVFVRNKEKAKTEKDLLAKDTAQNPYRDWKFMLFMFFCYLMLVSFFQILSTVPLYLKQVVGFDEGGVGLFYGVNGIMIFFVEMPLIYYVERKFKSFSLMNVGTAMMGFAILALAFPIPSILTVVIYLLFASIGEIVNFPFISTTSMNRANLGNIGKYMSVNTVMFSLAIITAPKLGTTILDAYGFDILFIFMGLISVVSIVGLEFLRKDLDYLHPDNPNH